MNPTTPLAGLQPTNKPRVRVRTHLTSFQLDKEQKQTIDQAYQLFNGQNEQFVSKGEFVEGLALDYIKRFGGKQAQPEAMPPQQMPQL